MAKRTVVETKKRRVAVGTAKTKSTDFHLNELLPYLINRVANATTQLFARDIAPFDLSVPMWRVIAVLSEMGEQRLVDLATMTSIDASTLSRLVETMQADKLLAKVRSKTNRRELVLTVAPRGKELSRLLAPVAQAYETRLTAGLPESELATARKVLKHMFHQLSELKAQADLDSRATRRQTPVLAKTLLRSRSSAKS
ncbi:MarR family winged helix-turn-helix transcriptional regulator [Tardiphaga sp. 709]|uniref:MarR family winged helix-turn-helix transcriptional regulator n=1 Tax=Tardiphaga sp. 709 TaxID=3076039 RepID=UPI0028EE2D81|nr:MarR family winged helix-turn-helix transcriptional regulator [Tardiphaga sp. 709]WNV11760.1 MarR family winged helix-turn-helix transcriptional regulator [Tardiphaga sp. 709]